MMKSIVTVFMVTLIIVSMFTLAFNVWPVNASGTIYIRADGSIDPLTAPISSVDNVTYTFTDNIYDEIVVERDNITIDGTNYTVEGTGSGTGIDLSFRSNVTVQNVEVTNFNGGIRFASSSNNTLTGNTASNNDLYGIYLGSSSFNIVSGNNITANNYNGVWLNSSSNNRISGNNITATNYDGIWLYSSSNYNSISGNTFTNGGLSVAGSFQNSVENNTVNGRPLVYLEGVSNYTVDDAGQVILVRCENIRVEGLNLSRTNVGIELLETSNSSISGNNITANNQYGVWLNSSSNNRISGNNITANNMLGIELDSSSSNSIQGNNITNNWYGIYLSSSSNNTIQGNNITANNFDGIGLYLSSSNSIRGNNMTANNGAGIGLYHSSSNSISGNNITANNYAGIYLDSSSSNRVFHNNLINNTNQVYSFKSVSIWDDGYPSGGNYWSNYTGVDSDHNGIGDTSYTIYSNCTDNYPLMGMFSSFNTSLGKYTNIISNSTIEDFTYFESNSTIRMHVSNMTGNQTHGFVRITIPHALMTEPYSITIDGVNPTYWNYTLYDNGTHRWIYFEYEHSAVEVVIIPEFPVFMILPLLMTLVALVALIYRRKRI
jgi:parallel beta-helix repeat protein